MKFCVYKTTHPTGFYYVGKGITERVKKGHYKGSGVKLKAAFQAGYPFDEWTSTILHTFDDEDAAFAKEREIVNWDLLMDPYCLNTHIGGRGWKYGRLTEAQLRKRSAKISAALKGQKRTKEQRAAIAQRQREVMKDRSHPLYEAQRVLAAKQVGKPRPPEVLAKWTTKGLKMGEDTRRKQREKQLSHARILCLTCNESFRPACFARYHGEKCKGPKQPKTPAPTSRTCEVCSGIFTPANYGRWHGPKCRAKNRLPE